MNIVRGKVTFDMLKSLEPKPISQFQQDLVDKIIKLNNLKNADRIVEGQKIRVRSRCLARTSANSPAPTKGR